MNDTNVLTKQNKATLRAETFIFQYLGFYPQKYGFNFVSFNKEKKQFEYKKKLKNVKLNWKELKS